jgi:hypothetical protein
MGALIAKELELNFEQSKEEEYNYTNFSLPTKTTNKKEKILLTYQNQMTVSSVTEKISSKEKSPLNLTDAKRKDSNDQNTIQPPKIAENSFKIESFPSDDSNQEVGNSENEKVSVVKSSRVQNDDVKETSVLKSTEDQKAITTLSLSSSIRKDSFKLDEPLLKTKKEDNLEITLANKESLIVLEQAPLNAIMYKRKIPYIKDKIIPLKLDNSKSKDKKNFNIKSDFNYLDSSLKDNPNFIENECQTRSSTRYTESGIPVPLLYSKIFFLKKNSNKTQNSNESYLNMTQNFTKEIYRDKLNNTTYCDDSIQSFENLRYEIEENFENQKNKNAENKLVQGVHKNILVATEPISANTFENDEANHRKNLNEVLRDSHQILEQENKPGQFHQVTQDSINFSVHTLNKNLEYKRKLDPKEKIKIIPIVIGKPKIEVKKQEENQQTFPPKFVFLEEDEKQKCDQLHPDPQLNIENSKFFSQNNKEKNNKTIDLNINSPKTIKVENSSIEKKIKSITPNSNQKKIQKMLELDSEYNLLTVRMENSKGRHLNFYEKTILEENEKIPSKQFKKFNESPFSERNKTFTQIQTSPIQTKDRNTTYNTRSIKEILVSLKKDGLV